jgi:hypothetical protein
MGPALHHLREDFEFKSATPPVRKGRAFRVRLRSSAKRGSRACDRVAVRRPPVR